MDEALKGGINIGPAYGRAFAHGLFGGGSKLTNQDFNEDELNSARQAVYNKMFEVANRPNAMFYGREKWNAKNKKRDWINSKDNAVDYGNYDKDNNKGLMDSTLGRFFFTKDRNGNVIVNDNYNVNGDEGYTDPLRTIGLKILHMFGKPYDISLNLGNPNDWNFNYTGNNRLDELVGKYSGEDW